MRKNNSGFSLVELMVAMVIGLIIILGAGQLFLTVFQTNRQVERLSEKQAAVNFAVEALLKDIRRACQLPTPGCEDIVWDSGKKTLTMILPNRGDVLSGCGPGDPVEKVYRLSGSELSPRSGWALEMGQSCPPGSVSNQDFDQVVLALAQDGFNVDEDASDPVEGIWVFTIKLMATDSNGSPDPLTFHAVNRTAAVTP